jgi:hypothetical protein
MPLKIICKPTHIAWIGSAASVRRIGKDAPCAQKNRQRRLERGPKLGVHGAKYSRVSLRDDPL